MPSPTRLKNKIDVGVERDHIESLTKANGVNALCELLWNSLDADATEIHVDYEKNSLGSYEKIEVRDNGRGLLPSEIKAVFGSLGGSVKKQRGISPSGRAYHGQEGKGRYKSLALGNLVNFNSISRSGDQIQTFTAQIDANNLTQTSVSEPTQTNDQQDTGFLVTIQNINQQNAENALSLSNRLNYQEKLATYFTNYPVFKIFFNGHQLLFDNLEKYSVKTTVITDGTPEEFVVRIVEWNFDNSRKTYFCNANGIPFTESNLGIRSSLPISIYIQSTYIEDLHRRGVLQMEEMDETLNTVIKKARAFARNYNRRRLANEASNFISTLKERDLYPFTGTAEGPVEEAKRQVFDIVALQVHDYLPSFDSQDDTGKKLLLRLIKEALESDTGKLNKILSEIIELPASKREELTELLETTSLSDIIDAMAEIKNRLYLLNGLEQIIYDKDVSKNVLERKHLHKIVARETWLFGDEYTYGVDDVTLKNVLKSYLKDGLGREDFEEIVESGNNDELFRIPDVCLWHQYNLGSAGKKNLVIELKKPTVDAGFEELNQINRYAARVVKDPRFSIAKTRWAFLLLTRKVKDEIAPQLQQQNREYGHVLQGDNYDVFVLPWGHVLQEAKMRHEYIKDKLNLTLQGNEQGLNYLKEKYSQFLPADLISDEQLTADEEEA